MVKLKLLRLIIFVIIFTSPFILPLSTLQAVDATRSASPSEALKYKLKELQESIASRAAKLKNEIGKKLTSRAYVGTIQAISGTTITLATQKGVKIVNINDFTEFRGWKKPKINSLANGDFIVALGDIDDTEGLTAKRIISCQDTGARCNPATIKSAKVDFEQRQIIWGRLVSSSQSLLSIRTNQNQVYNFAIAPDTEFRPNNLTPLNKPIIVVATKTKDNALKGRFIYIPNLPAHSATAPTVAQKEASTSPKKATSSALKKTSPVP